MMELFPTRPAPERVAIYAVSGGVPAYVELFTRTKQFVTALQDHCLAPGSLMFTDPALILHEQLREPQTFESILSSIASGFHLWREIAKMAGVSESSLGHYLKILLELELVERRDPVLSAASSRQGRYYVRDHFLRFYYRFIVPRLTSIERGYLETVVTSINQDLRAFIGTYVFEELCREWVLAAAALGEIDFSPEEIGAYWRKAQGEGVQLDVVAANRREKRLLIGEAKWGTGDMSRQVWRDLLTRSQLMPQVAQGWTVQYVLFAREGFTPALQEAAQAAQVRLVGLEALEQTLLQAQT
jgi:predicted AAA+ superfamily ATPase